MAFFQGASKLLFGAGASTLFVAGTSKFSKPARCEEPAAAAAPDGDAPPPVPILSNLTPDDVAVPKLRPTRRRSRVGRLPNPGRYEEIQKECKEVLSIDAFGGARFEVNYMPVQTNAKQMGFVLNAEVDNTPPPSVRQQQARMGGGEGPDKAVEFGATLASENQLWLARVSNDGRVMGRFHHAFANKVTTRNFFQSAEDLSLMMEADFEGKDFFFHVKSMYTPDGPSVGTSYLQSITPSISLGAELMHQVDQGTHMSFSGRYANNWNKGQKGDYFTGQLSTMGIIVGSYTHKVNPYYLLSTEFMLKPNPWTGGIDPSCQIGALLKYQSFRFQASITNTMGMTAMLENTLQPGLTFILSGAVAHFKNTSKFGIGFRLG